MSKSKYPALFLAIALFASQAGLRAQQRSPFELIDQVSKAKGIPIGALEVSERSTITYPETNVVLEVAKVLDTKTGESYIAAVDQNGRAADPKEVQAAEDRAREKKHGKLDRKLSDKLRQAESGLAQGRVVEQDIPVAVWLHVASPRLARPNVPAEQMQAAFNSHLAALEQHLATARAAVLAEVRSLGKTGRAAKYSPTVFANLKPSEIRKLERNPSVAAIFASDENTKHGDNLGTTARTHRVWAAGNTGAGTSARLAVHEDDGVSDGNPFLNNLEHPVIFFCADVNSLCPLGKNIGDHATEVAGVATSTHPLFRGHAPNAQVILSANSQSLNDNSQNVEAFEWAVGNGAGVVNLSWGQTCPDGNPSFSDRYADWATSNLFITQTISSGNDHPACPGNLRVSMPGGAWTPITVGAHSDVNTGFWNGDFMSAFSRHIDPNTGATKPEVVSVGQDVKTTDSQGGDWLTPAGINGTSFSSPSVAGTVLQMLSRQPGQRFWPETNKAAIIASAVHDIEAGTGRDGHGAVVSTVADDTYRFGRFRNDSNASGSPLVAGDFNTSCAPVAGTNCRKYSDAFSTSAGTKVRVVVSWDAWSTGGNGTSQLGADLDIYVVHPNNTTLVGSSTTVANAYEVVDFTAPATGTYDIVLKLYSSAPGWPGTFIGTAWSFATSTTVPNFCAGEQTVTVGSTFIGDITRTINTVNGGTYFNSYSGLAFNQTGREGLVKIVLPVARNIRISDTNPSIDLHLVQLTGSGCNGDPVTFTKLLSTASGPSTSLNRPAGTYYVIADGRDGTVGSTSLTINISAP
ncbi:MAG TPA: S8 family serine peptidase [Bryobacteraceae bacterium]|nr:S8 family serine peptidase [Bryobacteraceae bacterium]